MDKKENYGLWNLLFKWSMSQELGLWFIVILVNPANGLCTLSKTVYPSGLEVKVRRVSTPLEFPSLSLQVTLAG